MNYLIQFPTIYSSFRFLAEGNTLTLKLTEALIFPTAAAAGEALDKYVTVTGTYHSDATIRPTGL